MTRRQTIDRFFDLTGRTAVVTGAGGGIGREAALTLAAAGANAVVADLNEAGLSETVKMIQADGGKALAVPTDVAKRRDVDALVEKAKASFGSVDVMANIAGIIRNSLVAETKEEDLDAILAVNLKGVYFGCAAAARVMVAQKRGSIINVASAGMDFPAPTLAPYAMTKSAVAMLARVLATEVGPYGVRVNSIAPGFTDSPMTQRWFTRPDGTVDTEKRDALWKTRAAQAPLNAIGEPMDQALAILYLASDASKFMTGQVLRVNGGVSMMP